MKKVGAVPTSVTSSEAYTALESGVVDAVAFAPHAHLATGTYKVGKWATTNLNLAGNDTDADDGLDLTSITIVSGPTKIGRASCRERV